MKIPSEIDHTLVDTAADLTEDLIIPLRRFLHGFEELIPGGSRRVDTDRAHLDTGATTVS